MDSEINLLDVLHSMMETDRIFYQTLRFLSSDRELLMAAHQRNTAVLMALLRAQIAASTSVTYTATIPINLPEGWNEPVVVRPTAAQISAATQPIDIRNCACSICQDDIDGNGTRISHCGHTFHTTCIAEWFTRSVHCPNCRRDVREVGRPVPTSSDPEHTPPRVRNRLDAWLEGVNPTNRTEETEESDEHHA